MCSWHVPDNDHVLVTVVQILQLEMETAVSVQGSVRQSQQAAPASAGQPAQEVQV